MSLRFGKENYHNTSREKITWRPNIQWVRGIWSHNVRACEPETRYEFITYKGINDGKKSVNSISVILGGRRKVIMEKGAWIAHVLDIKLKIKTNRRQFDEGW